MPQKVVRDYAEFISSHMASGGVLFEQNFDNSHFALDTFCDPEAEIAPVQGVPFLGEGRRGARPAGRGDREAQDSEFPIARPDITPDRSGARMTSMKQAAIGAYFEVS